VALARRPNVYVMLSGQYGFSNVGYPYDDLTSTVRTLFDAYGPQRMFWASDYPWIAQKPGYGKLIELPKPDKPVAKVTTFPTLAEQDANYRQRNEANEHLVTAQKKVDGLQKELDAIEQHYYEENDPDYRDNVIQQRFRQTKRQLQDAQHDLADARDVAQKLTTSSQR
jgi:hypothetical protein